MEPVKCRCVRFGGRCKNPVIPGSVWCDKHINVQSLCSPLTEEEYREQSLRQHRQRMEREKQQQRIERQRIQSIEKQKREKLVGDEQGMKLIRQHSQSIKKYDKTMFTKPEKIGSGVTSVVFSFIKNEGRPDQKTVVIKEIPRSKSDILSVLKEVNNLRHLQEICSSHLLCFSDFMEDDDNFYIITEHLGRYQSLSTFIQKKHAALKMEELIIIMENLKTGLILCHHHGIAHRDIKPDNIMIDPTNLSIKYIDFGLACQTNLCYDSDRLGTPYYKAPEIYFNQRKYREFAKCSHPHVKRGPLGLIEWIWADYWSLGVTIIEIFLGEIFMDFCWSKVSTEIINLEKLQILIHGLFGVGQIENRFMECCQRRFPQNVNIYTYLKSSLLPLINISPNHRLMVVDENRSLINPFFKIVSPTPN